MSEHRGDEIAEGAKSLGHGYRANAANMTAKTVTGDTQRTWTGGYRPATSHAKPAKPSTPPPPPSGKGGGSK